MAFSPSMIDAVNHSIRLFPTSRAIRYDFPDFRTPALREMEKSSCSAALSTLSRVFGETFSGWENARETVAVDTPALAATSSMLAFILNLPLLPASLCVAQGTGACLYAIFNHSGSIFRVSGGSAKVSS